MTSMSKSLEEIMAHSGLVGSSFTLTRTGRAAYWALLIALVLPSFCVRLCVQTAGYATH
jgi:hypothetical protein